MSVIAQELMTSIRRNLSVDWIQRKSAGARMRVLVKRILPSTGFRRASRMLPCNLCCSRQRRLRLSGLLLRPAIRRALFHIAV